ncbi:stage V sporulation protein AB [Alteribacillus iranensis]|uniref:Stage V sporulation protein AB n=1 Tax=Alteribacillus iranensis TaxID=930128 RepID=A0A1I1ZP89_9BACI|nr:stage V sporulation protein AB [Alteribacillus iranensis]SFE32383.1 stage V sporulation protein AB [Alteribacillus iranensis]
MEFKHIVSILIGLSGGIAVGGGFVAFITVLGIIPRLVQLTKTYKAVQAYEMSVITGAIAGSVGTLHMFTSSLPGVVTVPIGLAAGIFVGMLAAALTEVLNVFPILTKRIGQEHHLKLLIMAIVLGKITGSLFQWLIFEGY